MWHRLLHRINISRLEIVAVLLIIGLFSIHFTGSVHATLSSCSVNLTPQSIAPSSDNGFTFSFFNSSDNPIQWVKVTGPTGSYLTVESGSANGWISNNTSNDATFTTGSLAHGSSQGFVVQALANSQTVSSISWSVLVSDDPTGANPISCDGDLTMSIAVPVSIINISNVRASNVSSSGITIAWDTDVVSTTQVSYGLDGSYGSASTLDSSLVTSHSVSLTGLTSNTGYHYQVTSTTPDGGTASSGDGTFLTAVVPPPPPPVPVVVKIPPINIAPVVKPTDKIPPTISITSNTPKIMQTVPTITGTASDETSVIRVEYSTDAGQNWLPVDSASGLGGKHVDFSFTPTNLNDGSYVILARAIDGGGNITVSSTVNLVIDRLPPIIGGYLISFGPQVLVATDSSGALASVVGIDQKITLSAVGGPTTINLIAQKIGSKAAPQVFSLTMSSDTGLWSGIFSFSSPGKYSLMSNAVDGADNKTSQLISNINVTSQSFTYSKNSNKKLPSVISLFYFEPDSSTWVLWDGSSYGQVNPQSTDQQGNFKLFLPPGKYYLKATATGYKTVVSNIFETKNSLPITTNLAMNALHSLNIGPLHLSWPSLAVQKINLTSVSASPMTETQNSLIGKPLPNFALSDTTGVIVHTADLLGKPTLVTIGSTWSPTMSEQLAALSNLQTNHDLNIVPIALQENLAIVRAHTAIAGLNLKWLVDPDGTISPSFGSPLLPTNYFVDRNGIIRQVSVGALSQSVIENTLGSL